MTGEGGRVDHTATLLSGPGCGANCGKVLLAGGSFPSTDPGQRDPTAELYDPATGTFRTTGELAQTRYQHSATRLKSGKVLVAGGTSPPAFGGPEPDETKISSELYDPATETWRSCSPVLQGNSGTPPPSADCPGQLNFARYNHSATLLLDGSVLAAAGTTNSGTLSSAERYNPATGTWSVTKSVNDRRAGHGDALLPSGKVLIAGGRGRSFSNALGTSELYDAATPGSRWNFAGFMTEERGSDFTQPRSVPAVLLSADPTSFRADSAVCGSNCGKVLVAGGLDGSLNNRRASAELYTPASAGAPPKAPAPKPKPPAPSSCPPGNSAGVSCQRLPGGGLRITGTAGNDTIVGSSRDDVISCGDGNDVVRAGAGNDVINCGAGNDRVDGGAGNDRLNGDSGNDRITASTGNDRAIGGSGDDLVHGNEGNDRLGGQSGRDRLSGHSGNDTVNGDAGNDRMAGSSGRDRMSGGRGNDRISGGSGPDRVRGNSGDDILSGNSGNDTLIGDSGRDRLTGNSGKDRLLGGSGRDRLNGGSGRDRARQ